MTALTPERIAELRAIYEPLDRGTTHWVGCETEHARCAMYRALDTVEALQAERDRLRAALDAADTVLSTQDPVGDEQNPWKRAKQKAAWESYVAARKALAGGAK